MPSQQIAFIFPPFAHDYPGNLFPDLHGFQTVFSGYLKKASLFTGTDLENFNTISCDFLDDELKTQYIAYILGCTLSDYFDRKGIVAGYSAGYSMGIYTALHHAGAIYFETGLDLIRSAYALIRETIEGDEFLMGSIIGLTREDILQLKHSSEQKSEITIRNSDCSFILSG
ncbi:MAG: hypothetical protein Q8867_07985, partial [Bacteroidota bacterium]|nr:hypothetical protein [Bacteroidota bacterium]